ncbi:phage tail assembly protein [Salmonella enterica]|nr:phage tail assembly protein [Salmonella enterica]
MNEKYTLQFPFTSAAGERIDVLQLRRLKVKDMRAARRASDKPEEWDEPLMAAMTGLVAEDLAEMDLLARWFRFPPSEIDALSVDDFTRWLDEASAQIKHEYDSQA